MNTLAEQWKTEGREEVLNKKDQWINEGELKNAQEMLLEALSEKFGTVDFSTVNRIKTIDSRITLKMLFKQSFRVETLEDFKEQIQKATDN